MNRDVLLTGQASYDAALARVSAQLAADPPGVHPDRRTCLLTHGHPTARSIVLLHGLTNSPPQFVPLGQLFFRLGYNVYIPRMPHHGLQDRLTDAPGQLTVVALKQYVLDALNVGLGLAPHVTLGGISAGAVLAAWCAHQRADLAQALVIAPAFAPINMNIALTTIAAIVMRIVPNRMTWWDPVLEYEPSARMPHAYPRWSSRAMAATMWIGIQTAWAAIRRPPRAGRILVVTTATDNSVNNRSTARIVRHWQRQGANVRAIELRGLPSLHDIIDPAQTLQVVDTVYPAILALVHT